MRSLRKSMKKSVLNFKSGPLSRSQTCQWDYYYYYYYYYHHHHHHHYYYYYYYY
jgi:hypothetical protein